MTPTVEDARRAYAAQAGLAPILDGWCYRFRWYGRCAPCDREHHRADAASLTLDNAMAERHGPHRGPTPLQRGEQGAAHSETAQRSPR